MTQPQSSADDAELKFFLLAQLILLSSCLAIEFISLVKFLPHREDAWHFPMLLSLVWTVVLRLQHANSVQNLPIKEN